MDPASFYRGGGAKRAENAKSQLGFGGAVSPQRGPGADPVEANVFFGIPHEGKMDGASSTVSAVIILTLFLCIFSRFYLV